MSNLLEHAKRELELSRAGESLYGDMLPQAVLELMEVFANQGHSGMSAGITLQLFNRLAKFEPWMPLTGEDDEWTQIDFGPDMAYQNKRCSHVFKGADGRAYDSEGIIFEDPDGVCGTNSESRVYIEFPYTPEKKIVKRGEAS